MNAGADCRGGATDRAHPTETLHALARRVLHLNPDRQDAEAFLIAKDGIAHELRCLARQIGSPP